MRRLIWGFAGRTYHIVGNLMHWLIYVYVYSLHHFRDLVIIYLNLMVHELDTWKYSDPVHKELIYFAKWKDNPIKYTLLDGSKN